MARIIVWHRTDLRLADHEPLWHASQQRAEVIPVYCFDPSHWGTTAFGFAKTGPWRSRFLLEAVADLRRRYQALGSDLLIRWGRPEVVLPELIEAAQAGALYYHRAITAEEVAVETAVTMAVKAALGAQVTFKGFWGHTLHHRQDLPMAIAELPDLFTQYRKAIERSSAVRDPYPAPTQLSAIPGELALGTLPALADLGCQISVVDPRAVLGFVGGETAGLERVQDYLWERDRLRCYKETRNGMKGADYSSKFSPWLALGCLSPRWIWAEVQRYEVERVQNDSTYWLIFELLWRDYFYWVCAKYGNRVFQVGGLQRLQFPWDQDPELFHCWAEGMTGYPLVDANMRELKLTGFMSNRGRQNVASFLTKNLGIDWRMGAEWFESWLIDYDPCSNWGNWNYTAGVGNDARGFRFFNISKQAKDYDREGDYVKHWLPELANVPSAKVHEPWRLLPVEQERFAVTLGRDYPEAIVDLFRSAKEQEQRYNRACR